MAGAVPQWWQADKPAPAAGNWWEADAPAPAPTKPLAQEVAEGVLSPGVGALKAVAGAPGLPVDLASMAGRGLNWMLGREWQTGADPAKSGFTSADWIKAADKPEAAPGTGLPDTGPGFGRFFKRAGDFLLGYGGLGYEGLPKAPANDPERIGEKAGGLIMMGGPAGAGAGLTSTVTSEIGRGLDKAGITPDGWGETGGLLVGPLVHQGVVAAGQAAIPNVNPDVAESARYLRDRGVDVSPVQMAESDMPGYVRSGADTVSAFPSSFPQRQNRQFVRAVSQTIGEDAERITPQLIDRARSRIGGALEQNYASSTVDIANQPNLVNAFASIEARARAALGDEQFAAVERATRGVFSDLVDNGPTPGNIVWNRFKTGAIDPLNIALNSTDPGVAGFARQIKSAVLDAMADNAPANFRTRLRALNQQYSNLETIAPLATRGRRGWISPQVLLTRVRANQYGNSDLAQLAQAGADVLSPLANSGTTQRAIGTRIATGAPPVAANAAGATFGGLPGLALTAGLPPAVRGLMDSPALAQAMIDKALPAAAPPGGLLTMAGQTGGALARSAPGTVGLLGRQYVNPAHFYTGLLQPP